MLIREHHASLNRKTLDLWEGFQIHRQHTMQWVREARKRSLGSEVGRNGQLTRIAILGAGNANDLDMAWMTEHFDQVHLFDLDRNALAHARNQSGVDLGQVRCHAPFDVAAPLVDVCERFQVEPSPAVNANLIAEFSEYDAELSDLSFDVVVSVGLLSQLLSSVTHVLPQIPDEALLPLFQVIRAKHFERVHAILRPALEQSPGGVAILGFDFVSTDTAPVIASSSDADLKQLAIELINQRNFFTGMNPAVLLSELIGMDGLQMLACDSVWRWEMGPRQYLVTAAAVQRTNA